VCSDATRPTALLHDARTCTAQLHNGRGTICLDKRCHGRWTWQGASTVCSGHGSHREAGARSLRWTAPWGPHHPSHRWYERVHWRGAAPQQGPVHGLALVEGFDNGRLLAPLRVLDRNEPPGFGVASHLKGRGRLPRCLGCFCFPFRHVRSPQKRVSTMLTGYDAPSR